MATKLYNKDKDSTEIKDLLIEKGAEGFKTLDLSKIKIKDIPVCVIDEQKDILGFAKLTKKQDGFIYADLFCYDFPKNLMNGFPGLAGQILISTGDNKVTSFKPTHIIISNKPNQDASILNIDAQITKSLDFTDSSKHCYIHKISNTEQVTIFKPMINNTSNTGYIVVYENLSGHVLSYFQTIYQLSLNHPAIDPLHLSEQVSEFFKSKIN